ncbi:hypothetical protein [Isorropodon fossajaponicum symbiont]|nr:hypothetical protein [Isorropodon fossajaponicum symbiont]
MKPFIRHAEKWRTALVLFIAVLGGLLTNAWVSGKPGSEFSRLRDLDSF